MFYKQESLCLSDRTLDPIQFHIWQNLKEQISSFVSYIFRGLRLIDIQQQHNSYNPQELQDFLHTLIGLENKNECVLKIIQKIETILGISFESPNSKYRSMIEEINKEISHQYQKYKNALGQEYSISRNNSNNCSSLLTDLQQISGQDRKLKFKEQIAQPNSVYYRQLSKNQINLLNKINKITTYSDIRMQKAEKFKEIEVTIIQKLSGIMEKMMKQADLFRKTNHIQKSQLITCRPITVNQSNSISFLKQRSKSIIQTAPKQSFQNFLNKKIFNDPTFEKASNQVKVQNRIASLIIRNKIKQNIEQQAMSRYLSNEKLEKIKFIQNYFRKYLKQKNNDNSIFSKMQQILSTSLAKKQALIRRKISSQHEQKDTNRTIRMNSSNLINFLTRQGNKQGYDERVSKAKQKKLFQAVQENSISIIQNSGFMFGYNEYNSKDDQNNTALFYSARNNYYEMCRFLLENKANPNIRCSLGRTATHMACGQLNKQLYDLFAQNGADFNMPDDRGKTPQEIYEQSLDPSPVKQVIPQTSPKFDEFLIF